MLKAKNGNIYMLIIFIFSFAVNVALGFLVVILKEFGYEILPDFLLVCLHIFSFIAPFIFYVVINRGKLRFSEILPLKNPGVVNILLVIGMAITIQPIVMLFSAVSSLLFPNNVSDAVTDMLSGSGVYLTLLIVSIMPAITEEITIRGVVLSNYKSVNPIWAAIVTGLYFGLLHMNLQQFPYTFILGIVLALVVIFSKSVYCSMLFHFAFNGVSVLLALVLTSLEEAPGMEAEALAAASSSDMIIITIVTFAGIALVFTPVFIALIYLFYLNNKKRLAKEAAAVEITNETVEPDAGKDRFADWAFFCAIIAGILLSLAVTLANMWAA